MHKIYKSVLLVIMLIMSVFIISGCTKGAIDPKTIQDDVDSAHMFITISCEFTGYVVVDKETNVMYWLSRGGHAFGVLTMLVNEDGTPKIWKRLN